MKIAYIYDFKAYPPRGGNHLHALQLIRRFIQNGHIVNTWGDNSVSGVNSFDRSIAGGTAMLEDSDVLYVRIDGNHISAQPMLCQLIKQSALPMVWEINSPADESLAFSYIGGDRASPNGMLRIFDRIRRHLHAMRKRPGIVREDRIRAKFAKSVYAATCVSSGIQRYASECLGISVAVVVPNGADPDSHTPKGELAILPTSFEGKLKVVFAGSPIYPWAGFDLLMDTIRLCDYENDNIQFALLLNQESGSYAKTANAELFLAVPHDEVANFLRAADVAVVVSREVPWSRWGSYVSPMKMYDYMACGCPVVGSRVGQIPEIIVDGENGFLFDNSPESLRSTLLKAYNNRQELSRVSQRARELIVKERNWDVIAQETLRLLEASRREPPPSNHL